MRQNRDNLRNALSSNVQLSKPKPTCDAPDTIYPGYTTEVPHIAEIQILGKSIFLIPVKRYSQQVLGVSSLYNVNSP